MSKPKPSPKRTTTAATPQAKPATAASKRTTTSFLDRGKGELLFERKNYLLMGVGILFMILGFILMSGGGMESPEVWDKDIIYSARRTVLAPALVIAGLVIEIVAIFAKTKSTERS